MNILKILNLLETKNLNFVQFEAKNPIWRPKYKIKNIFFFHNCVVTHYIHILCKFHEDILIFEFARHKKPKFWAILSKKIENGGQNS